MVYLQYPIKLQRKSVMVGSSRPEVFCEKRCWHRCLPVNFAKFLRTPSLKEHLWWLLLDGKFTLKHILVNIQVYFKCHKVGRKNHRTFFSGGLRGAGG